MRDPQYSLRYGLALRRPWCHYAIADAVALHIGNKTQYKKTLLQQLVDEQSATLAVTKELALKNVENDVNIGVAKQELVPSKGGMLLQEEDVNVIAEGGAAKFQPANNSLRCVEIATFVESPAFEDEPKMLISEKVRKDIVLKKRRMMDSEVESVAETEHNKEPLKKKDKAKSALEATAGQVDLRQRTPYCVVRTPTPPNKYFIQKRREEEASGRESVRQQQPHLLASLAIRKGGMCTSRSLLTPRNFSRSMGLTTAEFERKLCEYVRLHRELNTKSNYTVMRKRQLPRLPTPLRCKTHWDFVLEEVRWMATDFAEERNWKRVLQHRLAADVIIAKNSGSVRQELENRQMARDVALQVSAFWRTMERIAARSRVRFEAAGTNRSDHGEIDITASGGHAATLEDDSKQSKSEDVEMSGTGNDTLTLKYYTFGAAASNEVDTKSDGKRPVRPETVLTSAKDHVTYIVSAGKRARSAMTSLPTKGVDVEKAWSFSKAWSLREAAIQALQARCTASQAEGKPVFILATFQLLALRWMLDLYSSGLNMFLNDQLGMGKAATIVAFLSLIEIVPSQKQYEGGDGARVSLPEPLSVEIPKGPHLIIVSGEELHKWRHYLRVWHPDRRIQFYDGAGKSLRYKAQLQREWNIKFQAKARKDDGNFLAAPLHNDDDEGLDDDGRVEPIYCVLCSVDAFVEDQQAYVAFTNWQMVVVENEHGGHFDDSACVSALQQLRQQQRRVLCNGQSIENWKNTALRLQYAEFLVWEAYADNNNSNSHESCQHQVETWPVQELQVERSSVAKVMHIYGKSSSVRAALWKASSQQEDLPKYMNALLLALSCLSLRRVRSEVETELRKIEEVSLSCKLSLSQSAQYRNALSGFVATLDTAGGREERLSVWLQLLLRLRQICNCVDLATDMEKLGHADLRLLTSCSAKLEALEPLLRRLALQEGKKVVIYCQFHGMFPVLELFLSLLDISYVRITGSISMQRRALYHFADRPVVRVALASTRLSTSYGGHAVSVYGSEAIVVVDSDWNATCDAKLRASWAKTAVGGADTLSVYRLHCENTVEASLLRVGASLTEKVFGEITPQELLAVPSDMALAIEKPGWWSPASTSSGGNGLMATGPMARLATVALQVERNEKYTGSSSDLEAPLIVHNVDLDAEEHLLLANTDELTPVEWYAVNFVHGIIDKKPQQGGEANIIEEDIGSVSDEGTASWGERNEIIQPDQPSFEKSAALDVNRHWQEGDVASQLFFSLSPHRSGVACNSALEKMFMQMRTQGMETHFDVVKPPQLWLLGDAKLHRGALSSEAGMSIDTQVTYRISYRVSVAPPPLPQTAKLKVEHAVGQHGDMSKLIEPSKKQRASAAIMAVSRGGMVPGSNSMNLSNSADMKRKLESQLRNIKLGPQKEQRVDLEGIPVPDVSEFADDDFWGDTNLDALDSAEWDDPALLGGILGVGVGGTGTGVSSTVPSSCTAPNGAGVSVTTGAGGSAIGARADLGHYKTPLQKSSKKPKMVSGRARKSGVSSFDSGRDVWTVHSDVVLQKLFELYGANWTLIAQVLNSTTAVSRFVCKKRSPRQCYDRYGKIISDSFTSCGAVAGATTKDGKSSVLLNNQCVESVVAAQLTPTALDTRIGLARDELLVKFFHRHSFPGLPPPSIASAPNLVEAHRQKQATSDAASKELIYTDGERLHDLQSIKTSFDAIIQCMKRKTSPPPIPIPVGAGSIVSGATATPTASRPTDLGTKASLTAASFPSSHVSTSSSAPSTPTKASATAFVPSAAAAKAIPVVVPPPHKSYTDMVSLLPGAVLSPDEVIKRSKDVPMVAVQAATTVAPVGREGSPLSASGDVMLGAGSGFGVTANCSVPRRLHAASLTSEMRTVSVVSVSTISSTGTRDGGAAATVASAAAQSQTTTAVTTGGWGGIVQGVSTTGFNASAPVDFTSASDNETQRNAPIPVTTSTLLHVLDRMPEIKNKIQSILNRTDCSESQKVAMIARLLSNTNAINNPNAFEASPTLPQSDTSVADNSAMFSALTADPGMLSSPDMLIDTETPIPMPASLGVRPPNGNASSISSSQEKLEPPPKKSSGYRSLRPYLILVYYCMWNKRDIFSFITYDWLLS
ncbi:unnamed protein product [Peronospora belbahrii]|uniref:HSA domain-containing protein n=1 Tax=Peronospora belbahrii TaxID=622444 RepID=A0ABN8CQV5_9STRA|nr:unnamed protein product [Peronospora belbahrii]